MTTSRKTNRKRPSRQRADGDPAAAGPGIILYSRTLGPANSETAWDREVVGTVPH